MSDLQHRVRVWMHSKEHMTWCVLIHHGETTAVVILRRVEGRIFREDLPGITCANDS